MRIEVLGSIRLRDDDGNAVEVPERKVRALLASLIAADGDAVPAEKLVNQAWGEDPPENPVRVLQAKLSQLRTLLDSASADGRRLLVRTPGGYSLDAPPGVVDAAALRRHVEAAADATPPQHRADALQEALRLWQGEPYAEFADALWLAAETAALRELRLRAVELRAEALIDAGDPEGGLAVAAPHLAENPTREALVASTMLAGARLRRQPEALAAYERLRSHLAEAYGTDPSPELHDLHVRILRQDPELQGRPVLPTAEPDGEPRPSLPAYSVPFHGRETEVGEILDLLDRHRLVTLMGIGGIGKTRIAVETAERAARDGSVQAHFVDLAELEARPEAAAPASGGPVELAVAAALGLSTPRSGSAGLADRIATSLQGRRTLLVLDNCEHVLEGVVTCARRLLRGAASLRILATSREPLGLPEERRFAVPLLATGAALDGAAAEPTRWSPAVAFFLACARAVNPGLEVDGPAVRAATELCRRLDGLPLALELAAVRTSMLGIEELLERITDRLDLLTRPGRAAPRRQQTLRGMLDWSWSLLDPSDRVLLRRLAVHPGSWRLDSIERIVADEPERSSLPTQQVLPALSRLVDAGLLTTERVEHGFRYRMLETVHSYAAEKLEDSGERPTVTARHLSSYRRMVESAGPHLFSQRAQGWVAWIDAERTHLTHALAEAIRRRDGPSASALALSTFWFRWMTDRTDALLDDLAEAAACSFDESDPAERNLRAQVTLLVRSLQIPHPGPRMDAVRDALDAFSDDDAGALARAQTQWFACSCLLANGSFREPATCLIDESVRHLISAGDLPAAAFAATQRDWFLMEHWGIRPLGLPGGHDAETILREHGDLYGMTQVLAVQYLVAAADEDGARLDAIIDEGADLTERAGLHAERAFWELARTLNHVRDDDLPSAGRRLQRTREIARRTGYAYVLTQADAVEATLSARRGDPDRAERLLGGLTADDRDLAHRTLSRILGDHALPGALLPEGV